VAFLVAIEGIDGSGKGTQSALLVERLRASGRRAELISFPRYQQTEYGRKIGDFLNGRFGALDQVHPLLVSLLFAGDRFESREWLLERAAANEVLVFDRYVASNIAHQGAKAVDAERDELLRWIEFIEYGQHRLPRMDLTLWLEVPVTVAVQLIRQKSPRSYTEQAADLQEADAGYLGRVHAMYHELASREPGWQRITCVDGAQPRPIDAIGADVLAAVERGIAHS
jgi:dTMP kinase